MSPLLTRVLEIASREVGVREVGRNRGQRVEMYQASVGLKPGDPWCAAFVGFCFLTAAHELGIACPLHPSGGALKMWSRSDPTARTPLARPGCVFVINHGGGLGHCGLVESVEDEYFVSIEGNTNDGGSREGDGVYRRKRGYSAINVGYIDVDQMDENIGAVPKEEMP